MRFLAGGPRPAVGKPGETTATPAAPTHRDLIAADAPSGVAGRAPTVRAAVAQALRLGEELAAAFAVPCVVAEFETEFDVYCPLEAEAATFSAAWASIRGSFPNASDLSRGPLVIRPALAEPVRWVYGFRVSCPAGSVLVAMLDTVPRTASPQHAKFASLVRKMMAQWTADVDAKAIALSAIKAQLVQLGSSLSGDHFGIVTYDFLSDTLTAGDEVRALIGDEPLRSTEAFASWLGEPAGAALVNVLRGKALSHGQVDHVRQCTGAEGDERRLRILAETVMHDGVPAYWIALLRDVDVGGSARMPNGARRRLDPMTGTLTRAAFDEVVSRAIDVARAEDLLVGLVLVDIDGFRAINIEHGHPAGDDIIRFVGRCLTSMVRSTDSVVRLAGDEFALVLHHSSNVEGVIERAERIATALKAKVRTVSGEVALSCSLGVSVFPDDGGSPDELLRAAKQAVLDARKGDALPRVKRFDPTAQEAQERTRALIARVRSGVADGEFAPFFQPKLDLHTGKIKGFEALLRWNHPTDGTLTPGRFYQALDDKDVGGLLSDVSLHGSFQAAGRWAARGLFFDHISVNLNAQQLEREDLVQQIEMLRRRADIPARAIVFEVLETVLIRERPLAFANLQALSAAGYRMALDDFGTGFASLSHIREPFITEVKIDRSFVTHAASSDQDRQIVAAIVQIARKLRLTMVAEGIEDEETLRHLRALGCTVGQGFVFAAAIPEDEATEFIARQARIDQLVDMVG